MKKIYLLIALSFVTVMTKAQCLVQVSGTNIQCNGLCNGTATATPVGVPSYSYLWQPGGMTTATVSGLCPGTYTVTVVDGSSCSSSATVTITQPAALSATTTHTNTACGGGCNGAATAFVSGGTGPYTHKWTTTPAQTNATATNLCAGTYNDTIADSHGCKTTLNPLVTITQPVVLNAMVTCSGVSCFGGANGSAMATQTGGTPGYKYSWNTIPAQTTSSIYNLSPGTYSCTVTDTNGCVSTSGCTVNQPAAALSISMGSSNASCSSCCDGSATSTPAGGTAPYTYSWSPGGHTTQNVNGLCPGNYTVCVTDAKGCNQCNQVSVNFNAGINELPVYKMYFYPNPTSGDFEIEINPPVSASEVKFTLVDIIGNEVFSESINHASISHKKFSVQMLPAGIYFLKMEINKRVVMQKLVKN
ncbi:MAG TPA: T9SS type A sorting domain-containing protein [Bacteroidia bacterium]|jgi:hypothetical protein|nr:T9SS type A sorting domain-containing protein [Bacteroidia bacterium]